MITILILMILGVSIAIWATYDEYYNDLFIYIINSIGGLVFGGVVGFVVAVILPMETYNEVFEIENLQDNNSVSGSFYLGCGQIDGKMKYVCYREENGLYSMIQLDYNLVQVRYTDSVPKVIVSQKSLTKSTINYFALDADVGSQTYIIEVPKGTIKNNYQLDAQ